MKKRMAEEEEENDGRGRRGTVSEEEKGKRGEEGWRGRIEW